MELLFLQHRNFFIACWCNQSPASKGVVVVVVVVVVVWWWWWCGGHFPPFFMVLGYGYVAGCITVHLVWAILRPAMAQSSFGGQRRLEQAGLCCLHTGSRCVSLVRRKMVCVVRAQEGGIYGGQSRVAGQFMRNEHCLWGAFPRKTEVTVKLVQPQHAAACRSMPQHAAACRSTCFLELHMGVLKHAAACRSMPQRAKIFTWRTFFFIPRRNSEPFVAQKSQNWMVVQW